MKKIELMFIKDISKTIVKDHPFEGRGGCIIIGAGPGDPELITVKAVKYLQSAEVILADRLVSNEIISRYASPHAKIIFVGKEGGKAHSVSQEKTNRLLLQYTLQGKLVVRLKGGDVAFFSNVLDELATLRCFNIPYEIVPGITAASGASAYSGIPLTARGFARGVRFQTFSSQNNFSEKYWNELAHTEDTIVFYMCGGLWRRLADNLLEHSSMAEKKLAVIEQATTPFQKVFVYSFDELKKQKPLREYVSPSLIIVGKVVALHEQFAWKENDGWETKNYFNPINSKIFNKVLIN
ncbi:MAG: uroporphyrinogen-III C-methyltransferase [Chitinophagaceae bacterium]|jgi:uroporphyrin-III C-methyltransferase|nr:uroporphyrinogen-III C-methyltransferase [Chitinophagaceae bacterium]